MLPTHGAVGLLTRLAVCAAIPPVLLATGFVHAAELRQARALRAPACGSARLRAAGRERAVSRPAVSVVMPFAGPRAEAEAALAALAGSTPVPTTS